MESAAAVLAACPALIERHELGVRDEAAHARLSQDLRKSAIELSQSEERLKGVQRRMEALLSYESQYGGGGEGAELFPSQNEVEERLAAVARFYGNLIGVKYGEPFVVKETMSVEDVVNLGVRSI